MEEFAFSYATLSENNPRALALAISIVGAVIAALTNRSASRLKRVPYFAIFAFLFLLTNIVSAAALQFLIPAIASKKFWIIVSIEIVATLVFGFLFGRAALARSRDAFENNKMAALAFIPIANFWLLFSQSKNPNSPDILPTIKLVSGKVGVAVGFAMLIAGVAIATDSQLYAKRAMEKAVEEGAFRERFVGQALEQMAQEVDTPMRVDDVTNLIRIETDENEMIYIYEVTSGATELAESMQQGLIDHNCGYEGLSGVIEAGATIRHRYLNSSGAELGTIIVNREICSK